MAKKIRSHILPKFYLKGFSDEKEHVWSYRHGSRTPFKSSLINTSVQKGFYYEETEKHFAQEIETLVAPIIVQIREQKVISQVQKRQISEFITHMMLRVPNAKSRMRDLFPSVLEDTFRRFLAERTFTKSQLEQIAEITYRWGVESETKSVEIWQEIIRFVGLPKVVAALLLMSWQFFTRDTEPYFITSDNPVFYPGKTGIGYSTAEVTFPISKHIAIWATWNTGLQETYIPVKDEVVHEINRRTSSGSDFIYSSVESPEFRRLSQSLPINEFAKRIRTLDGTYHIVVQEKFNRG